MDSMVISIVNEFIAAINEGNASRLSSLMSKDHIFIDSQGTKDCGRDKMRKGWEEYFRMFPDYRVEIQDILQDGNVVAVFGSASGTYSGKRGLVPENRIEMPAAWKAVVDNGKVKFWQVYADWTEGWKIINEDTEKG